MSSGVVTTAEDISSTPLSRSSRDDETRDGGHNPVLRRQDDVLPTQSSSSSELRQTSQLISDSSQSSYFNTFYAHRFPSAPAARHLTEKIGDSSRNLIRLPLCEIVNDATNFLSDVCDAVAAYKQYESSTPAVFQQRSDDSRNIFDGDASFKNVAAKTSSAKGRTFTLPSTTPRLHIDSQATAFGSACRERRPSHQRNPEILVISLVDPDALCAAYQLTSALGQRFMLNVRLIPVAYLSELRHTLTVITRDESGGVASPCIVFINIGARQDVRCMLPQSTGWQPRLFLIDYHRPLAPEYFYMEDPGEIESDHRSPACSKVSLITTKEETADLLKALKQLSKDDDADGVLDENEGEDSALLSLEKTAPEGEYFGPPAAVTINDALMEHNLGTASSLMVASVGLSFQFLLGYASPSQYELYMRRLGQSLTDVKKRCPHSFEIGRLLKYEPSELCCPLLRFGPLNSAVAQSAIFLRTTLSQWRTNEEVFDRELAAIRVALGLKDNHWHEQFRFLPAREQRRVSYKALPQVLQRLSQTALRINRRRCPPPRLVVPVLIRKLHAGGLPDRITSLDAAFLLLILLTRPFKTEKTEREDPGSVLSAQSQEKYRSLFLEGFRLIDLLATTAVNRSPLQKNEATASKVAKGFTDSAWDLYTPLDSAGSSGRLLAWFTSVIDIAKQVQLDIHQAPFIEQDVLARKDSGELPFVLRLLSRRKFGDVWRAAGNVEGLVDYAFFDHLMHPLIVSLITATATDWINRGDLANNPSMLLACSSTTATTATVVTFKANASLRSPNTMGKTMRQVFLHIDKQGMLNGFNQDYSDSTSAIIPKANVGDFLRALFRSNRPNGIPQQRSKPLLSSKDSSSSPSEASDEEVEQISDSHRNPSIVGRGKPFQAQNNGHRSDKRASNKGQEEEPKSRSVVRPQLTRSVIATEKLSSSQQNNEEAATSTKVVEPFSSSSDEQTEELVLGPLELSEGQHENSESLPTSPSITGIPTNNFQSSGTKAVEVISSEIESSVLLETGVKQTDQRDLIAPHNCVQKPSDVPNDHSTKEAQNFLSTPPTEECGRKPAGLKQKLNGVRLVRKTPPFNEDNSGSWVQNSERSKRNGARAYYYWSENGCSLDDCQNSCFWPSAALQQEEKESERENVGLNCPGLSAGDVDECNSGEINGIGSCNDTTDWGDNVFQTSLSKRRKKSPSLRETNSTGTYDSQSTKLSPRPTNTTEQQTTQSSEWTTVLAWPHFNRDDKGVSD